MNALRLLSLSLVFVLSSILFVGCNSKGEKSAGTSGNQEHKHPTESGQTGHAGNEGHQGHDSAPAQLIVSSQPDQPQAGGKTALRLMVHEASGTMIKDFEVTHEKLAHLIIVRRGLDEFAHVHPEVGSDGNITVEHTFPVGGEYLLFLDYKPAKGLPATAKATIQVNGDAPAAPQLQANVPGTVKSGGLQAEVSVKKESDGAVATFDIKDEQGKPVTDLQPYLGAMGHLVVISADGQRYAHSHPLTDKPGTSQVKFEVHFPGPGLYKMWGQFQKNDNVVTIPAMVQVNDADQA